MIVLTEQSRKIRPWEENNINYSKRSQIVAYALQTVEKLSAFLNIFSCDFYCSACHFLNTIGVGAWLCVQL